MEKQTPPKAASISSETPSTTGKYGHFRHWLKNSLLFRLNAGLMASLLVVLDLQLAATEVYANYLMENYVKSRLQQDSEGLLAALAITPDGVVTLDRGRVPPQFLRPFSGHYYRITISNQAGQPPISLYSRSLWDTDLSLPSVVVGESLHWRIPGPEDQDLLTLVSGYSKQNRRIVIAVAEDLSPLHADVQSFQVHFTAIFLVGIALLIGLQTWLVRASTQTLARTRNDIIRLERGEIEHINEDVPAEIAPLVEEVNRLLSILRQRLKRSRNALGNLAHALKTPLTLLTQLTDDPALRTHPALRERFQHHTSTLKFLIERELKRARLAGSGLTLQPMDLAAASRELIPVFQALYRDKGLRIDSQMPPSVLFKGDREDLLELLGNLLDNACKWARSQVRLHVASASILTFIIEDDGPGCTSETLARLTQRGQRFDEATPGHGLGLSIVKDIVTSYEGSIDFALSSDLGGLKVTVQLPNDFKSVA